MATTQAKSKRGGARPNSGPKPTGNAMTAYIVVRCHKEQRDYFNEQIGADWLRKTVDKKRSV